MLCANMGAKEGEHQPLPMKLMIDPAADPTAHHPQPLAPPIPYPPHWPHIPANASDYFHYGGSILLLLIATLVGP